MLAYVLALNDDGSVWVEGSLENPFNYPQSVILDKESDAVKGVPLVALFGPKGDLRGYVIFRPPMGNPAIPIGNSLYIRTGDRLVRGEPIGR